MELTLVLVTPTSAEIRVVCDSVRFDVPDGKKKISGGSVGIRHGHTDALFAVAAGKVSAYVGGKLVFQAVVGAGMASVTGGDTVSLLVHSVNQVDTVGVELSPDGK